MSDQRFGCTETSTALPIHADKIRVAEVADSTGAVLLTAGPQVTAGKAQKYRRPSRLGALALHGQEGLLHRIAHAAAPSLNPAQPFSRSSQAGQLPQP